MGTVVFSFFIIACMRVVQNICGKTASKTVKQGEHFFRYGTYYQLMAALFSAITLSIVGFYGFDFATLACAFLSAVFLAIDLFTNIEAMKGAPLTVCTMFSLGGLVVSCVGGMVFFDESMSVWRVLGLLLFFLGAYLLVSHSEARGVKISVRTYVLLFCNLLANGFLMIVQKYFSVRVVGGNVALFSFLTFALNAAVMLACAIVCARGNRHAHSEVPPRRTEKGTIFGLSKTLLLCGALLAFAVFVVSCLITELGKILDSVILFPVSSALSLSITAVIGWLAFGERLTPRRIAGLLLGLGGIVVLGAL